MERKSTLQFLFAVLLAIFAGGTLAPRLSSGAAGQGGSGAGTSASERPQTSTLEGADPFIEVLADHFGMDVDDVRDEAARFQVVRNRAARDYDPNDSTSVRFLIATLPDPIDSYSNWQFDPAMDAIEEAAAASGYVLDRFLFPDAERSSAAKPDDKKSPDPGASKPPAVDGRQHEKKPGIVLFRMDVPATSGQRLKKLLAVFVVPETATAGIHAPAFDAAVQTIVHWRSPDDQDPVLVLGPYFSGTSSSIAREIDTLLKPATVRVMSGSATADDNKRIFAARGFDFRATVPPDSAFECAIATFLRNEFGRFSLADVERYAKLQESNTAYGLSFNAPVPLGESPAPGTSRAADSNCGMPLRLVLTLRFPLHISRLRNDQAPQQAAATSNTLGLAPRFRPLELGDNGMPKDQIPVFTSRTSQSYAEMSLANLLSTIGRERIGVVNIMATDARDKLFLAREIARATPNVLMYTSESDLLYSHPDYYGATNGMLIASGYPLSAQNRQWSPGQHDFDDRRQFPTSTAQGVYNAALALLNYSREGAFHGVDRHGQLLGYSAETPCSSQCTPPVWISVVGHDAPWPVHIQSVANDYVFRADPTPASRNIDPDDLKPRVFVPVVTQLLAALLGLLVLAHLVRGAGIVVHSTRRNGVERCAYLALSSFALAIIWAIVCAAGIGVRATNDGWTVVTKAVAAGSLVLLAALIALTAAALIRGWRDARRRPAWWLAVVTLIGSAYELVHYSLRQADRLLLLLDRATHLSNGVTPLVPAVSLFGAAYLWSVLEIRRAGRPAAPQEKEIDYLRDVLSSPDAPDARDVLSRACLCDFDRSILDVQGRPMSLPVAAAVLLVVATIGTFAFNLSRPPLRSIDGDAFGHTATWLAAFAQIAVWLALVQFVRSWNALSKVLDRLGARYGNDVYRNIPSAALPLGAMPRLPRSSAVEHIVDHWWQIRADVSLPDAAAFENDINDTGRTPLAWCECWPALLNGARQALRRLDTLPATHPHRSPQLVPLGVSIAQAYGVSAIQSADDEQLAARRTGLQTFALLPVVFILRTMAARMWQNVLFVSGVIFLLIAAAASYRFQARQWIDAFIWIDLAATVAAVWYVFVNIEQDEILSLVRSTPGRSKWNPELLAKVVVYGVVPMLTLFAIQFPNAVQALLSVFEPVQKALP